MKHFLFVPALIAGVLVAGSVSAGGRNSDDWDRPGVGVPLRFQSEKGGAFRPRALVVQTANGAQVARLPAVSNDARPEDRVDLSGAPLIGALFQGRLAPADARRGDAVGPVVRVGDTLVVQATGWPGDLTGLPVTLATHTPRTGSVSYRLGRMTFAPGGVGGGGIPIGQAFVVNGALVIASPGNGAPTLEGLFTGQ